MREFWFEAKLGRDGSEERVDGMRCLGQMFRVEYTLKQMGRSWSLDVGKLC
jgi:hypothetical protein